MKAIPYGTAADTRAGRVRRRAWRIAQFFLQRILRRKYNYECTPVETEGPFLLIANHANNTDPIFVSMSCRDRPLTFVASEHLGRLGLITYLLTKNFSIILRKKASSAVNTVRSILKALRQGESVVLFAEGDCTWDGVSAGIFPATGKLARTAGVPLVTYRLEGNYLSRPRWARKPRKGRCTGGAVRIYSPEELAAMRPEEITAAIDRDIRVDAWELQRRDGSRYRSKAPAVGLEQALFLCPECHGAGTLQTKGNALFCTRCGMRAELDDRGFFRKGPFPGILEWDRWQKEAFAGMTGRPGERELFGGEGRLTDLSDETQRKVRFALDLSGGAILVDGEPTPLSEITEMAMVKTNRLLFSTQSGYYEIRTKRGILRPYLLAWQACRKNNDETEDK